MHITCVINENIKLARYEGRDAALRILNPTPYETAATDFAARDGPSSNHLQRKLPTDRSKLA